MQKFRLNNVILLLSMMASTTWCLAKDFFIVDGSPIAIMETNVHGAPKGSTIQASINGHILMVAFSENLGQVQVEVTTASGSTLETFWLHTPNGVQCYIPNTGDYIVTFTLPNGDEYYGEFTVTD